MGPTLSIFSTKAAIRNRDIDYLRCISTLAVLLLHFRSFAANAPTLMPAWVFDKLSTNGYYGVTLFFIVSGFVISRTMIDRYGSLSRIDIYDFYVRRASRILPALCAMLALGYWLTGPMIPVHSSDVSLGSFLQYVVTLRVNTLKEGVPAGFGVLWSLSIEESFYLAYPLLVWGLASTNRLTGFLLFLVAAGPISRHITHDHLASLSCIDQLSVGCLVAIHAPKIESALIKLALRLAGAALCAGCYGSTYVIETLTWGPSIMSIGAAIYLLGIRTPRRSVNPMTIVLTHCGRLSYELYLFHEFAILTLVYAGVLPLVVARFGPEMSFVLFMVLALPCCWLLSSQVFGPVETWMRRRFRRTSATTAMLAAQP